MRRGPHVYAPGTFTQFLGQVARLMVMADVGDIPGAWFCHFRRV